MVFNIDGLRNVGDMGELPDTLPIFSAASDSAEPGNADDHSSGLGSGRGGGLAGKPDDPVAGRRPDGHPV